MTDNELYRMLIERLEDQMQAVYNLPIAVQRNNQPMVQGVEKDYATGQMPQGFLDIVSSNRFGWPRIADVYNENTGQFDSTTSQMMQSIFRLSVLARQNVLDEDQANASDILNYCAEILGARDTVAVFNTDYGASIDRIRDVPSLYFLDDKEQFENRPNIEFDIYHTRQVTRATPLVTEYEGDLHGI